MVNLVIVSHSAKLAEGVKELADSMAGGAVDVAAVGGIANDHGEYRLGTDAVRICEAVSQIWSDDGVLLLVDLGSAVLSTKLALDLLPEEQRLRCLISNAPLVEGTVVAALEASLNRPLALVNEAAEATVEFEKVRRDAP